jgi:carboxymethylenebutenolidase
MSSADANKAMSDLWDQHQASEFGARNADLAVETMAENVYVNMVPLMNGGVGREAVREFYAKHFLPQLPPDMEMILISRTVGQERIVDEMVARFTHSLQIDWMLPGVPPTGKRVELPFVIIIQFEGGKISRENLYWDQASVLAQVGLIDRSLPVRGGETAAQVIKPTQPMNELIRRAGSR